MQGQDNVIPGYDDYVPNFMSNYEGENFHNVSGYEHSNNTFSSLTIYGDNTLNSTSGYGSDVGNYTAGMNQMPNYDYENRAVVESCSKKRSLGVVCSYPGTSGHSFADQMEPLSKKKQHDNSDLQVYQYSGYNCQNNFQMTQYDANQLYQWPQQGYNYTPMPPTSPPVMYPQSSNTIIPNPALPTTPKSDDEIILYYKIPGRLSVHGNYKHDVTLAELKRRIGAPEQLNQSLLAAYVRKAKSKESGEKVVQNLAEHGVLLCPGRRKSVKVTTLTSLIEAEAFQIVVDHEKHTKKYFDHKNMAYEIMSMTTTVEEFEQRKYYFWEAHANLEQFIQFMSIDASLQWNREPVIQETNRNQLIDTIGALNPLTQESITNYALLSHCFGPAFHLHAWSTLSVMCKEVYQAFADPKAFLDKIQREPPQIVTLMMYGMK